MNGFLGLALRNAALPGVIMKFWDVRSNAYPTLWVGSLF